MRTKLFISIAIVAGTFAFSGCQKEGCTDSNAINYDENAKKDDGSCVYNTDTTSEISLHFHAKLGTTDFAYGTEVTNWEGRKMKFDIAQVYLSGFAFYDDNGTKNLIEDSYVLAKAGTMMYDLGTITNDHYHSFGFSVGVDSVANHSDPASWPSSNALSSNNPDHAFWSWNSGYIFIKMEGMVDTTADMSGTANAPFVYHVGMDMMRNDLMFMNHMEVEGDMMMTVEFDFLELFNGIVVRGNNQDTHTMNNMPAAMAVRDNVPNAVTLE